MGVRVAVIALAALCDRSTQKRLETADLQYRLELKLPARSKRSRNDGLFAALNRLNAYRNSTSHIRKNAPEINALDFRNQVLAVCRALL